MTGLGLEVEVGVAPVEVGVEVGVAVEFLVICGSSTNKTLVTYKV